MSPETTPRAGAGEPRRDDLRFARTSGAAVEDGKDAGAQAAGRSSKNLRFPAAVFSDSASGSGSFFAEMTGHF